jgi:hypothetical protein
MGDIDWIRAMRRRSDHDLLDVVSGEGFEPEAVAAAQAELDRRGLAVDRIEEVEADLDRVRTIEAMRPDQPLSGPARLVFVFLGIFFFWAVIAAIILRSRSYRRKSREAFICIGWSFVFWGGVSIILAFALG